jgi:hypothetical protein
MSYTPNRLSIVSAIGVNSDSAISGGNWVGDTYTGAGEENDYAYVGVNLQVDEAGTLFFDFSQDGTNWSSYPVNGFDVASGINEVHTAWKGGRYMRPRFVGTGGRSFFRLKTYYSNLSLPLSAPLNQSIGSDQDATVVRSVSIGQRPDDTYINVPADGAGFRTTANLSDGATYDSGVLELTNYTQVGTSIICDNNGTLKFVFGSASNMSGDTVGQNGVERVITVPYAASTGYQYYSAPAFTPYVRYEFENTSGQGSTTQLFFDTRFVTKSISGQILRMDGFISPSMVANLGRSVIVGTKPNGNFENVSVTETTNSEGVYENLNVVSGARPSQLAGRTSVKIVLTGDTANKLEHTVSSGKTFYVTDVILTVDNADNTTKGALNFRDGLTITGSTRLPILVQEAPTNESSVTVVTHGFNEPLDFSQGVFLDLSTGTLTVAGIIEGYEE